MSSVFKLELRKPYPFAVRKSKIHNRGVFATRDIGWGRRLVQYTGEKISAKEGDRREKIQSKKGLNYILNISNTFDIDGSVGGSEASYLNHSCDPNCFPFRENGEMWLITLRDIKKGEELTWDYDFDDKDEKCSCGSTKCKGYI